MESKEKFNINKSVSVNGVRKSVNVEEVENGFVIEITKSDDEGYECKKFISKINPFAEKEEKEEKDDIMSSVKSLLAGMGEII